MSVLLDSRDIAPEDRAEVVHATVCSGVLPVEIDWDTPDRVDVRFRLHGSGKLTLSSAVSRDNRLERTAAQARGAHVPHVFLALQVSGSSVVTQSSRVAILRPGDMVVYDSTKPYSITNAGRTALHYFQVPRDVLALPTSTLDAVVASRVGQDTNDHAAVIAPFLRALGDSDLLDGSAAGPSIDEPAIDLIRTLVDAHVGTRPVPRQQDGIAGRALVLSVRQYVQDHLGDHDLTAARIAAAHHVSVRHLYAVLSRADISLHDLIQEQRLERCRRDLRDRRAAHLAVATIGARWGFVDPSHFGRVFKRRFGVTPYAWRRLVLRPGDDALL